MRRPGRVLPPRRGGQAAGVLFEGVGEGQRLISARLISADHALTWSDSTAAPVRVPLRPIRPGTVTEAWRPAQRHGSHARWFLDTTRLTEETCNRQAPSELE